MSKKMTRNPYYGKNSKNRNLTVRIITKIVSFLAGIIYRPVYHNIHYIPLKESYMLFSNHHSILDPVLIHLGMPDFIYWVAKEELFKNPILKFFLNKLEVISLNRDEVDLTAMRQIINHLKSGNNVGLFPQGKRVDKDKYEKVMPQAGVASICTRYKTTILPCYCSGPYKAFRKNHFYFGAPFCLNPKFDNSNKSEKNQELVIEIIRQCYQIIGLSYFPEK
ncbi:MAG TPA: 1-acyl-sn-glycerol-3-phosphate acyltransferase [Clostridiaceae bacterium]|nr:1-acyl-sn-glycerol-3-phosphate acyltransferase [Clostridiaceae bacterium]